MASLGALLELPDTQLVGLCRSSLNLIVRASDLPSGVAEPGPDQLAVLVAETGRRAVVNGWEPAA